MNAAITGLIALGGTNTQAGIRRADQLFNAVLSADRADNNHMILLSDGLPTQSYKIKDTYLTLNTTNDTFVFSDDDNYYTAPNLPVIKFDYDTTIGPGSSEFETIHNGWGNDYFYNHSNSAISQAKMFKDVSDSRTLWTIALGTSSHGNDVLKDIASSNDNALVATAADLNSKLQQIAGSINAAAKNINVTDPIAPGFEIIYNAPVTDITTSQGSKTYLGGVIQWNAGTLSTPITPGSTIKYVEMSYRVSILPSIANLEVPTDGLYPTNGTTSFVYKDKSDDILTVDFIVPKVNPIFLKVKKVFLDSEGNPITLTDPFVVNISSSTTTVLPDEGFEEFNENFNLIGNSDFVTSTELRLADTYTVSETTSGYDVTYKVNDHDETNTFTVAPPNPGDTGQNDIVVVVKNKLSGKIVLKKLLVDVDGNTLEGDTTLYPFNQSFTFSITSPNGYSATRTLIPNQEVTISGLRYGEYTVTETGSLGNFELVSSNPSGGIVTLSTSKKEDSVTIKNTLRRNVVVSQKVLE